MRVVLQRVSRAEVRIDGRVSGSIGRGYLLLVGITADDDTESLRWMADKILSLRLFPDDDIAAQDGTGTGAGSVKPSSFSRDLTEIDGEVLVVSQFTLYGDTARGRRPSFSRAAAPARALPLYESFVEMMRERAPSRVETGEFGAMMEVDLVNDGPVTLILERNASSA